MCACHSGWLIAGLLAATSPPASSIAFATVSDSLPQTSSQFQIVPAEHPTARKTPRSQAHLRPIIVVQSEGVSAHIRQSFVRAAVFGGLGILGMIYIGYRVYGRRQGRAAT